VARENRRMATYTEVFGHQPDLQKFLKGDPVKELQQLLDKHCYGPEPDGFFGDETERCLNLFKGGNFMMEDGLVDQATWAVLNAAPVMIVRLYGSLSKSGNIMYWSANNAGCPTIPAWTNISQCWAYERAMITNATPAVDFPTTSDQPIGTQEPFSIDLLTLFPNDGQYTAVVTVGPDLSELDFDVVNGQVV
jgi:peptidoglycan hydrolase-like protein with peptidoglycan-binding domain